MFKTVFAPIQAWLMSQGRCVGCGMPLAQAKSIERKDGTVKLICKCKRIYIHTPKTGKYRRALLSEA